MSNIALPKTAPLVTLLVSQAGGVVIALLVAFGVQLSGDQVAAIMGAVGFIGVLIAILLWATTVSRKEVVEKLLGDADGTVVAGEANDRLPVGTPVRTIKE